MSQLSLFDRPEPDFDGETYDPARDKKRLTTALGKVWLLLSDGEWHTLKEMAEAAGCTEAAASARFRDLKKEKFRERYPSQGLEKKNMGGGVWLYRMTK